MFADVFVVFHRIKTDHRNDRGGHLHGHSTRLERHSK